MKLKTNEWNGYTTYKVGKINDDGEGMTNGSELVGKIVFEPNITMEGEKFKSGKKATFNTGKVVLNVENLTDFENLEMNEYGSAQFDLPSNPLFLNAIKDAGKGTRVRIFMEKKTYKDKDGTEKSASGFSLEVLGEKEVKEHQDEMKESPDNTEEPKVTKVNEDSRKKIQEAVNSGDLDLEDEVNVLLENGDRLDMLVKDAIASKKEF